MNTLFKSLLATSLTTFAIASSAQSTVGELVDGGAKKMTKEELVAYIAGTKLTGPSRSGEVVMNIDFKAGGSFTGNMTHAQRNITSGTFGKWAVDEAGKTCADGRISAWNMAFQECFFSYKLGDIVYRTLAVSEDRATAVGKGLQLAKVN